MPGEDLVTVTGGTGAAMASLPTSSGPSGSRSARTSENPAGDVDSMRSQVLLERIRSKATKMKSFPELSRSVRSTLLDRRFTLDSVEKATLQKCLDTLQEKIPVRSAHGMAERLETIGRQIGLKFMGAIAHRCFYLSTEMFYVEISIDGTGIVNEAKIHHIDATQTSQQPNTSNCPEIMDCLSKGDFNTFLKHLKGLVAVYDIQNASAPEKSMAWAALTVVEKDLEAAFQMYNGWYSPENMSHVINETQFGLVVTRRGGLPMELRYFLAPSDLFDQTTKTFLQCTKENVLQGDLGASVTVMLENNDSHCFLPRHQLMASNGKLHQDMNASNSYNLPARFALQMKSPMPLSLEKCKELTRLTGFEFYDTKQALPLMQLIVKNKSGNQLEAANGRGLFVTLPDQQHCYFMSDNDDMAAVLVSSIPFTHPANVEHILTILRQQLIFNTLIESCVRPSSIQDMEQSIVFEVSYTDVQHLCVTFEHHGEESIQTLEIDTTELGRLSCTLYSSRDNSSDPICAAESLTKIMQQTMSVPVVMRAVAREALKLVDNRTATTMEEHMSMQETLSNSNKNNIVSNGVVNSQTKQEDLFNANVVQDKTSGNNSISQNGVASNETIAIKSEPMDHENNYQTNSLNMRGPQDVASGSEASRSQSNLKHSVPAPDNNDHTSSKNQSKSALSSSKSSSMPVSTKTEQSANSNQNIPVKVEPELLLTRGKTPPSKHSAEHNVKKETKKVEMLPSSVVSCDIKPSVSITPVSSDTDSVDPSLSISEGNNSKKAGIEIIPLGGGSSTTGLESSSSKSRDIKRSLSEDDKLRLDKKSKKRKHDSSSFGSSSRESSSSSKMKKLPDDSRHKSLSSSSKSKTASLVDRLAHSSASSGIEILPAPPPSSTSSEYKQHLSKDKAKDDSSSNSSLKLTLKSTSKYPKDKFSPSSKSSFSSKEKDKDKSRYSSSSGSSKGSSSLSASSSSYSHHYHHHHHHHHKHSSSSKNSSSSSSDKDRKRYHDKVSSRSAYYSQSSSSSSHHHHHSKDREEEVKKLFDQGKLLDKTFQIPKMKNSSSSPTQQPQAQPPPPQYQPQQKSSVSGSSISPKSQYGVMHPYSPKYIGGGSVTPPNISPKHSYSAPSSVAALPRSSPLHNPTPSPRSRTPSASPTHHRSQHNAIHSRHGEQQDASAQGSGGSNSAAAEQHVSNDGISASRTYEHDVLGK